FGVLHVPNWLTEYRQLMEHAGLYFRAHRAEDDCNASIHVLATPFADDGSLAMRHLLDLGHRCIGYINGPVHYYASALRLEGYCEELALAGIDYDPALVERGDWALESGYAAMQRLLSKRPQLTALFAGNDLMAAGAIYALQDAGIEVPREVAVVGYDDREISRTVRPRLSTVTLPCYEMGQAAAQMLLYRMEGRTDIEEEANVRGCLLVRESCGAVAPG
ncbi:MAG: substrate-binding domain-containing protein, partial [Caldilinea sp.]